MERDYIKLSPSSAGRWTSCTAAQAHLRKHGLDKFTSSQWAAAGTTAAKWAERVLKGEIVDLPLSSPVEGYSSIEIPLTPLHHYIKECRRLIDSSLWWRVEERQAVFYDDAHTGGFPDFLACGTDGVLRCLDLKYGEGKVVSPVENWQLFIYAESEARKIRTKTGLYPALALGICQPRIAPDTEWWTPSDEDRQRMGEQVELGWVANQYPALRRFVPSADACVFCPAKKARGEAQCPAIARVMEQAEALTLPGAGLELDTGRMATTATIRFMAMNKKGLEAAADAAREIVFEDLRANGEASEYAGAFYIAEGRKGNKRFADGAPLEKLQVPQPPKTMSPTQLAAAVKNGTFEDAALAEKLLTKFVVQAPAGPVLKAMGEKGRPYVGAALSNLPDPEDI